MMLMMLKSQNHAQVGTHVRPGHLAFPQAGLTTAPSAASLAWGQERGGSGKKRCGRAMAMRLVDDEAAPGTPHVTGAKATGKILRFHYHCSGKLEDFSLEETEVHKRNCELGKLHKCGRCRYLGLMAKEHRRFTC